MKRTPPALRLAVLAAAIALTAAGVSGCTGTAPSGGARADGGPSTSSSDATAALSQALASCGLSSRSTGVTVRAQDLALVSQPHGRPTDVVAASARCTVKALGMPARDAALFDQDMASGGFQTLSWRGWTATMTVKDTLHFEVDVFAQAA